jgi:phenylacetate-coenzyme A ligase PaaK-like adenylate-forming protein
VGDLLAQGLARLGVRPIRHGLVRDAEATLELIRREAVDCLVGLPVQVLALARSPGPGLPPGRLKAVLLSADYVPDAIVAELAERWEVPVFNHYGMTETGLGGAVECGCRCGYHLREADLLWEIVDPETGRALPAGEPGEAVFTTLTRVGMPLIRYRTGDLTRFLPEPCPCGTVLRRMARVQRRSAAQRPLRGAGTLCMGALDEALFPLPFLLDFQPILTRGDGGDVLSLDLAATGPLTLRQEGAIRQALLGIPALGEAVAGGSLALGSIRIQRLGPVSGSVKRNIQDQREGPSC